MGLDKKPSPPKRKIEKDYEEKQVGSWKGGAHSEPSDSSVEQKSSKDLVLVILPGHEASMETIEEKMETGQEHRGEERKKLLNHETEDSQEDTGKNGTVFQNTSRGWKIGEGNSGEGVGLRASSSLGGIHS